MPAKSQAQFKYMQGICHGNITPPKGLSKAEACEYVSGQTMKNLPKKLSKRKYNK